MRTPPPIAQSPKPSGLASYRALVAWLAGLTDADFADVDPDALQPIPVPVRVTARVVTRLQQPAPISSDDGSCIASTAAHGQDGTVHSDRAT